MYQPDLVRWFCIDPMSEARNWISPYNYVQNNPINRIDPNGALDTRYEDEYGNELLTTNDGSDDVVKVTGDQVEDFKRFGEMYEESPGMRSIFDSDGFNLTMKADLLGFDNTSQMVNILGGFNSQWARQNAINFLQNPTFSNAAMLSLSEGLSQWTNPELVTAGLSVGVAGYSATLQRFAGSVDDVAKSAAKVHGNSLQSKRPTWGYKLYSKDGTFLKNGITSKPMPESRYTKSFMKDKYMGTKKLFPNRRAAYDWEYQQNLIKRGPLNKNMH